MMMFQLEPETTNRPMPQTRVQIRNYSIQQPTYANQPLRIRMNGLTLSTGNLFQSYLIRLMHPDIATPLLDEEGFRPTYNTRNAARAFVTALERGNRDQIRSRLTEYYHQASGIEYPHYEPQLVMASPPPPPPPPPPGRSSSEDRDDEDDLAKKIANELATVYYLNLEITLDDVITAIRKFIPDQVKLARLSENFASKIVNSWIDQNRMQLRALLPDNALVAVALRQLQSKFFATNSIVSFIKNIWGKFVALLTGNDDSYLVVPPASIDAYRARVTHILDKYISWWKMSWFGHHHNDRANAVKDAINAAGTIEQIRSILLQQKHIMGQATDENVTVPDDLSFQDVRWNSFFEVKNRPRDPKTSGYYQVLEKALAIKIPSQ